MARGSKSELTLKQKRAIDGFKTLIMGNNHKSFVEVLRDAGYAPESARQWSNIMAGLRPHLQPTMDWLELHRQQIQTQMEKEVGLADYADLVKGLKVITEAIQLLGGKPTQNIVISLEDRARLDALVDT